MDTGSVSPPAGTSEMTLKAVKCFNCKKKGHIAEMCLEPRRKDATRLIKTNEESEVNHREAHGYVQ